MTINLQIHAQWYEAEPVTRNGTSWVSVKAHVPVFGHPDQFTLYTHTPEDAELLAAAFNACSRFPGSFLEPPPNVNWQVKMVKEESAA